MNALRANKLTRRFGDLHPRPPSEHQTVPDDPVIAASALLVAVMRFSPETV